MTTSMCLLHKNRQMSALMSKATDNEPQMNVKKVMSSYSLLKMKCAACNVELADLLVLVQQLRNDVEQKQICRNEKRKTQMNSQPTTKYHKMKARLTLLEVENEELKAENEDVKVNLVHERERLELLMESNEQLEQGKAMCVRVMEELRAKISKLSNANELLTSQVRDLRG